VIAWGLNDFDAADRPTLPLYFWQACSAILNSSKRRRRAIYLLKEGQTTLSAVARSVGSSKSSVFRWYQEYQEGGSKAFRSKAIPGRPPKLSQIEKNRLAEVLLSGPLAAGYRTDLWTLKRIAQTIHKHFGIRYHPNHVRRLLQGMGWSCQKPERRALQRNDKEIVR